MGGSGRNAGQARVMVLAAGLGTRLTPLTGEVSKPMIPLVNRPVMEHLVKLLSGQGFRDIMVNLHYLPELIQEYFGDGSRWGARMHYSLEEELMGTAGGVRRCRDFFGESTFIVVSGDALTDVDLKSMLAFHREKQATATIMATPVDDTSSYGVLLTDDDCRVTGFQEKPRPGEALSRIANSGIYIFEPGIFELMPPDGPYDFGRQLFPALVEEGGAVYAWEHANYWNDVGSIEEYRRGTVDALEGRVRVDIEGEEVQPRVWTGPGTSIDRSALITPPVCIGKNCRISRNARVLGPSVLGDGTVVEEGAVVHRGIIWDGSRVGSRVVAAGCIAGSHCTIGSGAVVSDGSVLGNGSAVVDGAVVDPGGKIEPGDVVGGSHRG